MPHPVPPSIESILQLSGIPSAQPSTTTLTTLMDSGSPSGSPPRITSPLPIDPNDNRPPGGTRRSNGTKTPRKVQWTDEREAVDSPRALDEHGLDPSAFQELASALERHRSDSPASLARMGSRLERLDTNLTRESTSTEDTTPDGYTPPSHQVPGEQFIDPSETAGLPGAGTERHSVQQAQQVINAHRRGMFGTVHMPHIPHFGRRTDEVDARGRKRSSEVNEVRNRKSHGHNKSGSGSGSGHRRRWSFFRPETSSESDVEKSAESARMSGVPRGAGVLSALLALYDNADAASQTVGSISTRSSFDESRPSSRARSRERERGTTTPRWAGSANSSSASLALPTLRVPKPWADDRPAQARNAGGVFGALIASTGNVSGVAAPQNSTLQPNVKRPGYHLSRYSLESSVPKAKQDKSAQELTRTRSMHFETTATTHEVGDTSPDHPSHLRTSSLPQNTLDESPASTKSRSKWTGGILKDLPVPKHGWSRANTPSTPGTPTSDEGDYMDKEKIKIREREKEAERAKRERRKRKKAEIYITRHVAEIVQRQEFILKLARTMMMFGGPTHRLQAQIQATGRVLDIQLSCMYLPDVMLISFDDATTSTSNIKFIRQASALDIGKLQDAYALYWKVIHDDISVKDASVALDDLMRKPQLYKFWQLIIIGGFCSASICSVSFNGSFIDSLISFPLGCLLIVIQVFAARNELYSNVFEIMVCLLFSFIAAALADAHGHHICYTAVGSASIVLILPGFIILCGSLELASRNIVSGAVRVCFSIIYSLFLGFGLSIGATAYSKLTHHELAGTDDLSCQSSHDATGPWWQRTPSVWWAFLTVPAYSFFLSLRNHAPLYRKETYLLVAISCIGWVCNHFTGTKFPSQNDIPAAVGGAAVGFVANLYGKFFNGNAFVVMITGILFQLPSGLANGGLFTFVTAETDGTSSSESYLSGFYTALQLVSVSIGLTVGLGVSLILVHPVKSRRRAGGIFSL